MTSSQRPNARLPLLPALGLLTVSGLVLAGCATTTVGSATTPSASSSTTATPLPTATATASTSASQAAMTFAATLTADQQASLMQEYSLANAAKWSNLPQALVRGSGARIGLQLSDLSAAQLTALGTLLQTVSGTTAGEGYEEIQELLNADDYLAANGGGTDYGSGNYFIAFLGTPSDTGTWELQFGGHHLAFANTYTNGVLAGATPSFRGVEPFGDFEQNGMTNAPLATEQQALAAMLGGLTSDQLATAKLDQTYSDILLGPGKDWAFPTTSEGIKGSDLTEEQKALVLAAIATYVDDVDDTDAATILAKYESELDDTYISYSGGTDLTSVNDYVRIDGPSVWIEFSMQHGIVLSGAHPHSVWRDRNTDYGGTTS